MSKLFISELDKKLKAIEEKKNNIYQNIHKKDLSIRQTIQYLENKIRIIIKKYFPEINTDETITFINSINNNNIEKKDVKEIIKKEVNIKENKLENAFEPGSLLKSFKEPIRNYGGWCNPNEILTKSKKNRNNSFFCGKFEGYE